jgi:hypothetical protein
MEEPKVAPSKPFDITEKNLAGGVNTTSSKTSIGLSEELPIDELVKVIEDPSVKAQSMGGQETKKSMIIHIVLGSLFGIVFIFAVYTCCCKKKRNPYSEFEDPPQRDEVAKQNNGGAINESFKDDLYDFGGKDDIEKD